MIWYKKHELRSPAIKAAETWSAMNPLVARNAVVIPLAPKTAVIEYAQNQKTSQTILFFPKGQDTPVYLSSEAILCEGNRRLKSRVETACRNYHLDTLGAERVKLAKL